MERVSASPSKKRKGPADAVGDEGIAVKIDPDMLLCGICAGALDAGDGRVFQCAKVPAMCASCVDKHRESCPDCLAADVHRCIALEHIVRGMRSPCPFSAFGCGEFISRAEKPAHEARCRHAPSACLVAGCSWTGRQDCVVDHIRADHSRSSGVQGFYYNKQFSFQLGTQEPLHLLIGKDGGVFALLVRNASPESVVAGSMIRLVCVQRGRAMASIYEYDLEVKRGRSSVALKSFPEDWNHRPSPPASPESAAEFLFVPRHFGGGSSMIVDLRIRKI